MKSERVLFFISWILASVIMFTAFYLWHGLFLNDLSKVDHSPTYIYTVVSVVYLMMGLFVVKIYEVKLVPFLNVKPRLKGLAAGIFCGIIIYFTSLVVGIRFTSKLTARDIMFDLSWQIIEQSLGGILVGFLHYLANEFRVNRAH